MTSNLGFLVDERKKNTFPYFLQLRTLSFGGDKKKLAGATQQ